MKHALLAVGTLLLASACYEPPRFPERDPSATHLAGESAGARSGSNAAPGGAKSQAPAEQRSTPERRFDPASDGESAD
jgi:hypothetical protein